VVEGGLTATVPQQIIIDEIGNGLDLPGRLWGNEDLNAIAKAGGLGGDGAQYLGDAVGEGGDHLALEPGTGPQGGNEDTVTLVDH